MEKIKLLLESENPIFEDVRDELHKNLKALETVEFKTIKEPIKPGTLGPEQIVGFVIDNYESLLTLIIAILNIMGLILARRKPPVEKEKSKANVVIIMVGDNKIILPASKSAQNKFLKSLEK